MFDLLHSDNRRVKTIYDEPFMKIRRSFPQNIRFLIESIRSSVIARYGQIRYARVQDFFVRAKENVTYGPGYGLFKYTKIVLFDDGIRKIHV